MLVTKCSAWPPRARPCRVPAATSARDNRARWTRTSCHRPGVLPRLFRQDAGVLDVTETDVVRREPEPEALLVRDRVRETIDEIPQVARAAGDGFGRIVARYAERARRAEREHHESADTRWRSRVRVPVRFLVAQRCEHAPVDSHIVAGLLEVRADRWQPVFPRAQKCAGIDEIERTVVRVVPVPEPLAQSGPVRSRRRSRRRRGRHSGRTGPTAPTRRHAADRARRRSRGADTSGATRRSRRTESRRRPRLPCRRARAASRMSHAGAASRRCRGHPSRARRPPGPRRYPGSRRRGARRGLRAKQGVADCCGRSRAARASCSSVRNAHSRRARR